MSFFQNGVGNKMGIGVLALQGGFEKHAQALRKLGVDVVYVKMPEDLKHCHGLILPGGESTVISRLLISSKIKSALSQFALEKPLFGTCSGLILMAKEGWLDVAITRNAYGSQTSSFETILEIDLPKPIPINALFIRAPKIKALLSNEIKILAKHEGVPVCVEQGNRLAMSFHPELTDNVECHRYFVEKLCKLRI